MDLILNQHFYNMEKIKNIQIIKLNIKENSITINLETEQFHKLIIKMDYMQEILINNQNKQLKLLLI
jgi:hypothetical protein